MPDASGELRVWGNKWIATRDRPHTTRGQGKVWQVRTVAGLNVKGKAPELFALKEMKYDKSQGTTAYRRFLQEIETTKRMSSSHEGIVDVVDSSPLGEEGDGRPYYVMPWAENTLESAKDLKGPDAFERVLNICITIAETLGAGHSADPPIIHRDVKPGNVLLFGAEREPRLADFGICYLQDAERTRVTGTDAHTVGSEGFTAPELAGGGKVDDVSPMVDVYSLGKLLYWVTSGGDLFPREGHRSAKYDLSIKFSDSRGDHIHGLLDQLVVEDPQKRLASMPACVSTLMRARENLKKGVKYTAGMYGKGLTASERFHSVSAALSEMSGTKRIDRVHSEIAIAISAATQIAANFSGPIQTANANPDGAALEVAEACSEQVLAVGLPLLLEDHIEEFDEWFQLLATHVSRGPMSSGSKGQILCAAGILAAYAAGSLAWNRRRFKALKVVVEGFGRNLGDWFHPALLAGNSALVLPWVYSAVNASTVCSLSDPQSQFSISRSINSLAGIIALKDLLATEGEARISLEQAQVRNVQIRAYPILFKSAGNWASVLANEFRTSTAREQNVAKAIFGVDAALLRDACRKMTPAIAAMMRQMSVYVDWQFDVDSDGAWKAWCGGSAT